MRVLLVDHEADFGEVLGLLLETDGHQVRSVESALRLSRELTNFRPDVAIVDLQVPIQRGFHLGRRIRKHTACGLIALSSWPWPLDERESACFDDVLTKPVNFAALRAALAKCHAKRRQ
jgi:DNA-binding response OmpR family regulator